MRYLGIDYGKKRVGLALSDETGRFALPLKVVANSSKLVEEVVAICESETVATMVIGESKNLQGGDNPIMIDLKHFVEELKAKSNVSIVWQPELFSSVEAERVIGRDSDLDARAAALILQSYLDRQK